jgi:hypothetical protein
VSHRTAHLASNEPFILRSHEETWMVLTSRATPAGAVAGLVQDVGLV